MGGLAVPAELQPARLHYRRTAKLGKGAFGDVYRGVLDEECAVAVKVLRAGSVIAARQFRRELRRYARLSVHGVVNFYGAARSGGPSAHIDVFVTELMPGGNLLAALDAARANNTRLHASAALRIAEMVANGLAEIHACGFSHGDVKPSNVLLSAPVSGPESVPRLRAKFVDFGLSRNLHPKPPAAGAAPVDSDDEDAGESAGLALAQPGAPAPIEPLGTPAYLAPEAWRGSNALCKPKVALAADVYALGILLYELDTGLVPWSAMSEWSIFGAVYHNAERPAWPADYEESVPGMRSIIERCWAQDFLNRPTAERVAASLRELRRNTGLSSPSVSTPSNSVPNSPAMGVRTHLEDDIAKANNTGTAAHNAADDEHARALQAMRMIPQPDSPLPNSPMPDWVSEGESIAKPSPPHRDDVLAAAKQADVREDALQGEEHAVEWKAAESKAESKMETSNVTSSTHHTSERRPGALPPPDDLVQMQPKIQSAEIVDFEAVQGVQQGQPEGQGGSKCNTTLVPNRALGAQDVSSSPAACAAESQSNEPQSPDLVEPTLNGQAHPHMAEKKAVEWGDRAREHSPTHPAPEMLKYFGPRPSIREEEEADDDIRVSITSSQAFADAEGSVKSHSDSQRSRSDGHSEIQMTPAALEPVVPEPSHALPPAPGAGMRSLPVPELSAEPGEGMRPQPYSSFTAPDNKHDPEFAFVTPSPPAPAVGMRPQAYSSFVGSGNNLVPEPAPVAPPPPAPFLPRENSSFAGPGNDLISSNSSDVRGSEKSLPMSPAQITASSSNRSSIKSNDGVRVSLETPTSPNSVPSSAFARARMKTPGNMRFVGRPRNAKEMSDRIDRLSDSNKGGTFHAPVPRLPTVPASEDNSPGAPAEVTKLDYPLKAEVQANDLNAVMNALHARAARPDDCAHALRALAVLVSGKDGNAASAVQAGALETLAVAVARHARKNPALARAACDVIFHLATRQVPDVEAELRANGACEHVIAAMRWHPTNVPVMQAASMALSALCRSGPAMCAIVVAQGGLRAAQRALARAATAFDADVPVAASALDAIAALADARPDAVADGEALAVVLRACDVFARETIDENVVRVLHSAARHHVGRDALLHETATVPALAKLMERSRLSPHAGHTLVLACDVVTELAAGPPPLAVRALAGSNIVEAVLRAMSLVDSIEPFNAGSALAVHSLVCVRRLSTLGLDMCGVLQNAHALDVAVSVVNCRLENMDVAIQAALFVSSLVSKLSGGPRVQAGIGPALDMLRALDETWLLEVRVLEPVRQAITVLEKAQGGRMSVVTPPVDTIKMAPVKAKNPDRLSGRGLFRWRKR